ncbi:MAG: tRNA (guanosine(46)-N7)-methyltransferase TrmB [Cyanobacteriota bacterium]|nr:tRNA (guanosine(46)-N7)-methyltransferase TrmB [Cyanobacteriota bacterium]
MVRQHVNPLSRYHQESRPLPPLADLFDQPDQPLHLDIGAARGRFLLAMAALHPWRNHLGLEIRQPLVEAAQADATARGLTNLHYLFGNANVDLLDWLRTLPPNRLELVTLQFPDPWFKTRHHKRRVLQPGLVRALTVALSPGRELFLQSDVLAVITPMLALIEASGCFDRPPGEPQPWPSTNPLPVATEREHHVLAQGLPVYRVLLQRNQRPPAALEQLEAAMGSADNPTVASPIA